MQQNKLGSEEVLFSYFGEKVVVQTGGCRTQDSIERERKKALGG